MDEEAGLCLGCGRSLAEIARWGLFSEEERRAIMAGLGARLAERAARMNEKERACRD